ncbi:hypothetical protein J4429_01480 [Candidatus Pacearchaeota archaeon]|nr:hypothetical protein [Candidatus Pacearchaeota archaeon]
MMNQTYRDLSRIFYRNVCEEISSREYINLRGPNSKERVKESFLESKFKISLFARPPLALGMGSSSILPGRTQVLFYAHGEMRDPQTYEEGFKLADKDFFRAVVRDPISNMFPFHIALIEKLKICSFLRESLLDGNYEEFVRDFLVVSDSFIGRFRATYERRFGRIQK